MYYQCLNKYNLAKIKTIVSELNYNTILLNLFKFTLLIIKYILIY